MRKGNRFTCLTAGLVIGLGMSGCGGDADDASEISPADQPAAPGTAAPAGSGGDPTTAPATGATPPPGTGATGGQAAAGLDPALVQQGAQAYASSVCVSCHGPNGQGTPLAPSFTDDEWLWVQPGQDMLTQVATIIRTGVSQPKDPAHVAPMLPFGGVQMNDEQVNALAAYVVSLGGGGS